MIRTRLNHLPFLFTHSATDTRLVTDSILQDCGVPMCKLSAVGRENTKVLLDSLPHALNSRYVGAARAERTRQALGISPSTARALERLSYRAPRTFLRTARPLDGSPVRRYWLATAVTMGSTLLKGLGGLGGKGPSWTALVGKYSARAAELARLIAGKPSESVPVYSGYLPGGVAGKSRFKGHANLDQWAKWADYLIAYFGSPEAVVAGAKANKLVPIGPYTTGAKLASGVLPQPVVPAATPEASAPSSGSNVIDEFIDDLTRPVVTNPVPTVPVVTPGVNDTILTPGHSTLLALAADYDAVARSVGAPSLEVLACAVVERLKPGLGYAMGRKHNIRFDASNVDPNLIKQTALVPNTQFYVRPYFTVRTADLGPGVFGQVDIGSGPLDVAINSRAVPARRRVALIHELVHVGDDFLKLGLSEEATNGFAWFINNEMLPAMAAYEHRFGGR